MKIWENTSSIKIGPLILPKKDWTFEFLTANCLFNIIVLFFFSLDSASPPFIYLFIFEYSQYKI